LYRKTNKDSDDVFKLFIFSFTLIQNCVTIKDVDIFFYNIQNIFTNEFDNKSIAQSIQIIGTAIRNRDLIAFENYDKPENDLTCVPVSTSENTETSIRSSSPFTAYYLNLVKENLSGFHNDGSTVKNKYYNPHLFMLLINRLYMLPMWSGLMLNICIKRFPDLFKVI
jgi:hypothetical protein